jgi:uncharacterized protein (TIGR02996 family)
MTLLLAQYGPPLLADVLADPAADVPRLIYADWLEDAGEEERAELIRVQIDMETHCFLTRKAPPHETGRVPVPARCLCELGGTCDLRRRERKLLAEHLEWSDGFARAVGVEGTYFRTDAAAQHQYGHTKWQYCRGFVEVVELTAADWVAHGKKLVRVAPLCEVRLSDMVPSSYHAVGSVRSFWWWWRSGEGPNSSHELPPEIWEIIVAGEIEVGDRIGTRSYPTEAAVLASLSAACLTFARR